MRKLFTVLMMFYFTTFAYPQQGTNWVLHDIDSNSTGNVTLKNCGLYFFDAYTGYISINTDIYKTTTVQLLVE